MSEKTYLSWLKAIYLLCIWIYFKIPDNIYIFSKYWKMCSNFYSVSQFCSLHTPCYYSLPPSNTRGNNHCFTTREQCQLRCFISRRHICQAVACPSARSSEYARYGFRLLRFFINLTDASAAEAALKSEKECFNSLQPSEAIWRYRSRLTLAKVMACCLTALSHKLNRYWFIISKVQWHSSEGMFVCDTPGLAETINH